MIRSMTGFGSKESEAGLFGKISIEIRSNNHKFLESVFHLPPGILFLEERIKKMIESKIKRGRVTCVISVTGAQASSKVCVNKALVKDYLGILKHIKKEHGLGDQVRLDTLMHLPGVLSVVEGSLSKEGLWPRLRPLFAVALGELVKTRQKEGRALYTYLKNRAEMLRVGVEAIRVRFNKALKERLIAFNTDEERSIFLKEADICEEMDRLTFHIRNFKSKLAKTGPVGKELDFIAQEMQREANTLAAKSFDASITSRVVQIKSHIEKLREQVQNIE